MIVSNVTIIPIQKRPQLIEGRNIKEQKTIDATKTINR